MKRLCQMLLLLIAVGLFVPGLTAQEEPVQGRIYLLPFEGAVAVNGRFVDAWRYGYDQADLVLYDGITGEILYVWENNTGENRVELEAVSRNNRYIAFQTGDNPNYSYSVYDRETDQTTAIPSSDPYVEIALSDQGDVIYSFDDDVVDDGVFVFNIHNGQAPLNIANFPARAVVVSADGRSIAFTGDNTDDEQSDGTLFLYDRDGGLSQITVTDSSVGSLSADGRYLSFTSGDDTLVPNDTNAASDIFVLDRQTGQVNRVSISSTGQQANGDSGDSFVSDDGRLVAFGSSADNLVGNDENGSHDVFLHDTQTGQTTLISRTPDNRSGNDTSWLYSMSSDGQYVYFRGADNLARHELHDADKLLRYPQIPLVYNRFAPPDTTPWVSGRIMDTNGFGLSDTLISVDGLPTTVTDQTGNYILVGLEPGSHTITASREQYTPATPPLTINLANDNITGQNLILQFEDIYNGRLRAVSTDENGQPIGAGELSSCMNNEYIAYTSLTKTEQNKDVQTLVTRNLREDNSLVVIHTEQESESEDYLICLDISTDGRFVLFTTINNANHQSPLSLYDRQTGQTNQIGSSDSVVTGLASISSDGHYVVYPELNPGDDWEDWDFDIVLYDVLTDNYAHVEIGEDVFLILDISLTANLVGYGVHNNVPGVLLYDVVNDQTRLLAEFNEGETPTLYAKISDDSRYFLYELLVGQDNESNDSLVLHDVQTNQTKEVLPPEGYTFIGDYQSYLLRGFSLSNNGRFVVFTAYIDESSNPNALFLYDTQTDQTELLLTVPELDEIWRPNVSDDGALITFMSDANNLVSGDLKYSHDVFFYQRLPQPESSASENPTANPGVIAPVTPSPADSSSQALVAAPTLAPLTPETATVEPANRTFFLIGGFGLLFVGLIVGVLLFTRRSRKARNDAAPPIPAPQKPVRPAPVSQSAPARQPKFCIKCGASLLPDAQFCLSCGTPVPPSPSAAATPPLLSQGITQVKQNQLPDGIQTLRQVVETSPDNAAAWLWLGIAFAKQKNKTAAQQCLEQAQALGHPQAAKALAQLQQM